MSMCFKDDESHEGIVPGKLDEMAFKTPLKPIKVGDEAFSKPQNITKEKLKEFMPKGTSSKVTDEIIDIIVSIENDTGLAQEVAEERLLGAMHLLGKQGVTLEKLINAVKYCSLKRHMTNKQAWSIVFPAERDRIIARGAEIDSHVSMFNSTYLVVEIDKMMLVPFYIMYDKYKHEALETQVNLMRGVSANGEDKVSPHVQHLASKAVYEMLEGPADKTIELKMGASDSTVSQNQEMLETIKDLVRIQSEAFKSGRNAKDIQKIHFAKKSEEDIIDLEEED